MSKESDFEKIGRNLITTQVKVKAIHTSPDPNFDSMHVETEHGVISFEKHSLINAFTKEIGGWIKSKYFKRTIRYYSACDRIADTLKQIFTDDKT